MGSQDTTEETLEAEAVEEVGEGALNVGEEAVDVQDVEKAGELLNVELLGKDTAGGELGEELAGERGDGVITAGKEATDGVLNTIKELVTLEDTAEEALEGKTVEQVAEEALNVGQEAVDVEDVKEVGELLNVQALGEDVTGGELGEELAGEGRDGVITLDLALGELLHLRLDLLEL